MTVKEFALRQLHWMVQSDPWVQEIFLAGGESLDQLAERILAVSRFDNFALLNRAQVEYYEKILGLPQDDNKSLDDRRAAIQAAWQAAQKPSLATVQAICDNWKTGGIIASYTPGVILLRFLGSPGVPEGIETLKEALEFDENIHTDQDFQLTSCCCPMWIGMIRKLYHELMPHVPGAVSPMIAAGRTVKKLHPDAVTIFVGPCIAKKAEAREADLAGAVDYVLTFQEMQDIFQAADIHPELLEESERDHSSRAGRIYARTGGVSEAVRTTVARLHPERPIQVRTRQADGVPACRAMIEDIRSGQHQANFFEGMGCTGGCVGGPKVLLDRETGRENVDRYGDEAEFSTPLDNPYVLKLLRLLGFDTVEEFLEQSDIFIRHF